jgi:hypothetical protein
LPRELAIKKVVMETLPIAAAKVTNPEGTNGRRRNNNKSSLMNNRFYAIEFIDRHAVKLIDI